MQLHLSMWPEAERGALVRPYSRSRVGRRELVELLEASEGASQRRQRQTTTTITTTTNRTKTHVPKREANSHGK